VILVTGATGFVGRHVVRSLSSQTRVRALVRDARGAALLSGVECELAKGDVTDLASLRAAARGCKAIVHLAAIITGKPADFERVIAAGTRNVIEAAQEAGVRRIVHVSALGTDRPGHEIVPYYRAKLDAERALAASRIPTVVLRPGFVFGTDGGALPRFVRIARLAPVTPVIGTGRQKVQPIWIDDLVQAITLALPLDAPAETTVEIGGPDIVDWNGLWSRLKDALGTTRPAVHLPAWLMRPQAALFERMPNPPLTRDQILMLSLGDNIVADRGEAMRKLGLVDPVPLAEQLAWAARIPAR
jgi:nucleoside-diphosphate-sugar epimerase